MLSSTRHLFLYLFTLTIFSVVGCSDDPAGKDGNNGANWDLGNDAGNNGSDDAGFSDIGNNGNNGEVDLGSDLGSDTGTDLGSDDGPECGNGMPEVGEECDDGNTSDDDACLTTCVLACGDGIVNAAELCDTGITAGETGACPTTCDDGDSCTTESVQGTGCQAECVSGTISACVDGDLCCAAGCNANTDDDCAPVCGNTVLEAAETCDPVADCPTACNDGVACTTDTLSGDASTCDSVCSYSPITMCIDADGCCPTGCNNNTDDDCSVSCGNNVLEGAETCDGNCPTSCDDQDACTTNVLGGDAAACTAECSYPAITVCTDNDGCCAPGCDANTDNDCSNVCGNNVLEPGEECDDGNQIPTDACDQCVLTTAAPTAFMMTDLDLIDPHAFTDFFGCRDITNSVLGADGLNPQIEDAIQGDAGGDGTLDLSLLTVFRPLDQLVSATGAVDFMEGDCAAPFASATCQPAGGGLTASFTYTNQATGTCLSAVPNTTNGYSPALATPAGPCFVTNSQSVTLDLAGITITLDDTQFGATYVGVPATGLSNGMMRGFLTQAAAESITLPTTIPLVGGDSLASVLPGHSTNCASTSGMDTHPTLGAGWWMYLNFPAAQVPFMEP